MRKQLFAAGLAAALAATGITALTAYGSDGGGKTITIYEQGEHFNFVPAASGGPVGSRINFSAGVYDAAGNRIGRDGADCGQVSPDGTFHCVISVQLPDGELTFQGLANGPDNVFAITGGTGAYRNARGEAHAVDTAPGRSVVTIRLIG